MEPAVVALTSSYEAVAPLWLPTTSQRDSFREQAASAASFNETALLEATFSTLSERARAAVDGDARVSALAAAPSLLAAALGAAAEAGEVSGGGRALGDSLRGCAAVGMGMLARRDRLIVALLDEVAALRTHAAGGVAESNATRAAQALASAARIANVPAAAPAATRRRGSLPGATIEARLAARAERLGSPVRPALSSRLAQPRAPITTASTSAVSAAPLSALPSDAAAPQPPRAMTLHAVRDFLTALFASKARADARGGAFETLESHLYSFLRNTVGLRTLIASSARALLVGTERYARVDTLSAFARGVFRCELDEGFRVTFLTLPLTAADALRFVLRARGLSAAEVAGALTARGIGERGAAIAPSGQSLIPEDEWRALIGVMFSSANDAADATAALFWALAKETAAIAMGVELGFRETAAAFASADGADVDAAVAADARATAAAHALPLADLRAHIDRERPGGVLSWATIVRELETLALARQARFLRAFVELWRGADAACTGTLEPGVFVELIQRAAPSSAAAARSLADEAVARGGPVTFSAAVAALADAGHEGATTTSAAAPHMAPSEPPAETTPADAPVLVVDGEVGTFAVVDSGSESSARDGVTLVAAAPDDDSVIPEAILPPPPPAVTPAPRNPLRAKPVQLAPPPPPPTNVAPPELSPRSLSQRAAPVHTSDTVSAGVRAKRGALSNMLPNTPKTGPAPPSSRILVGRASGAIVYKS